MRKKKKTSGEEEETSEKERKNVCAYPLTSSICARFCSTAGRTSPTVLSTRTSPTWKKRERVIFCGEKRKMNASKIDERCLLA